MTAVFITILNMSITASVVALAVMLARVPLRKAPKIFSYALWGVVLFRLVFPFSIESIFSLMPTAANAIPQDIIVSQNPAIHTGVQFIDATVNAAITNALPPVIQEYSVNPIHVVLEIAGYVWLVGFIAFLIYAVIGYVHLQRRVYFATLVRDNIFETDKIKTPFVLGFIRPKIYFPVTIDTAQHDYILKHEQTHIKRRDYLIKPFAFAVLALHWFNPIMWVSYFLMSKDMEMSCDESVLMKTNEDIRREYSYSLLNLSVKRSNLLSLIAFGESNVQERIANVLRFKKTSKWVSVVSFIAVVVFLVGFTSNMEAISETYSLTEPVGLETAESEIERMLRLLDGFMGDFDEPFAMNGISINNLELAEPEIYALIQAGATSREVAIAIRSTIIERQEPMPHRSAGWYRYLTSVSRRDEMRFTEVEWTNILARIEMGEMRWED